MLKKISRGKPLKNGPSSQTEKPVGSAASTGPHVPVVGIGASAGGLEAFRDLLEALPSDTGMAFVLISHLSKTYKSMLSELLSKATKMPVSEVRGQTHLLANHIYVIPPNAQLSMNDGGLTSHPIGLLSRPTMVIDAFFRSLASHRKTQAIGVVLSGTGSDGTLGLGAIKAQGGIAFAQDLESAKYPDMPRSASAQFGSADFVLSPAQIAQELARIAGHPYVKRPKPEEDPENRTTDSPLDGIFLAVRRATGVDFSQYKPATIRRRIQRRMVLAKLETMADFERLLDADPAEIEALYRDLLINVTCFFRDPETFEYLQSQVLSEVLKQRQGDLPIRVWVPGCATGEEAYSIAMVLVECLQSSDGPLPPIQIFATDISKQAIQTARDGHYPENIVADVSPERLRRFFVKSDNSYQIVKPVRDLCIFAVQNVAKDPPFSRMDLIICRNLLIYLGVPLQRKVLATFHYALNPTGYLMLGTSETVEAGSEAFHQVDKKHKLYSKIVTSSPPLLEFGLAELGEGPTGSRRQRLIARPPMDVGGEADRIVLSRYAPPGVLINSSFDIIQVRGRTGPFLEPSPGHATLNLLKMAREGLALDLRTLIHQAKKTGDLVRKSGVRVRGDSGTTEVDVEVVPIIDSTLPKTARDPFFLVLFETAQGVRRPGERSEPPVVEQTSKAKRTSAEREMSMLRGELARTQNDLRSIIEEQEATNEELQSANEEILSSNEELQSTNEEMETAKEELQATNEELLTVNEELQNRNSELGTVNNDLTNLIESVDIVFVMLDSDLRIRRFTSAAQKILNLIPTDVGRPIGDIKPKVRVTDLPALIQDAIDNVHLVELDVQDSSGRSYAMKIRPSKSKDGKIEGAVLALTDIEALLRSQENRLGLESSLRSLLTHPPDLLLAVSPEGQCLFINGSSLGSGRGAGRSIFEYLAPQDREAVRRGLQQVLTTRASAEVEVRKFALRHDEGAVVLTIEPILSADAVLAFGVRAGVQKAGEGVQKKEASAPKIPESRAAGTS